MDVFICDIPNAIVYIHDGERSKKEQYEAIMEAFTEFAYEVRKEKAEKALKQRHTA